MTRKATICLLLAIMTLFVSSTAHADLFPNIFSTPTPSMSEQEKAPSYGGFANVDYAAVQPYAGGGQVVYYEGVKEKDYLAFGDYLEGLGYRATASEVDGTTVQMKLTNGRFNIGVIYYGDQKKLLMIYEAGVSFEEKALFPGYKRLGLNEEITIPNLGKFRFTSFTLNGDAMKTAKYYTRANGYSEARNHNTYLFFIYFNTQTTEMQFIDRGSSDYFVKNNLVDIQFVYINEFNRYEYKSVRYGTYKNGVIFVYGNGDTNVFTQAEGIPPLTSKNEGVVFDLPDALRTSTDGTIALLLDFKTGEKYYIPIRENGIDLYRE